MCVHVYMSGSESPTGPHRADGLRVHACVFVCEYHHSEGTCRGQERVSDPLELDFQGQLLGVLGMKLMSYG